MADPTGGSRARHEARRDRLRGTYGASTPAKEPSLVDKAKGAVTGAMNAVKETLSEASSSYDQFKAGVKRVKNSIPGMED